jgi:hypothetical protein
MRSVTNEPFDAERHSAKCRYAECRGAFRRICQRLLLKNTSFGGASLGLCRLVSFLLSEPP